MTVTARPPGTLEDPQLAAREQQLMELAAEIETETQGGPEGSPSPDTPH